MTENLPKTRYVSIYSEVVKFFTSDTANVLDAALVGDDLMLLQYQIFDDASDVPRKSNVHKASFTTANARVFLYIYLSKVKKPQIFHTVTPTVSCSLKILSIFPKIYIFKPDPS